MTRVPNAPKKCPHCQLTKITMNNLGDMKCECGYERLSEQTLKQLQENAKEVDKYN